VIGLYGGAFDPPHNGHVELARVAKERFGLPRLVVLVNAAPGHKHVETPAALRLEMARAAFPDDDVLLDEHARTIETLRAHPEWPDPLFLIGADQFRDFLTWTEPREVLRRTRLGVATRPGYPRDRLEQVLERLEHPDRVLFFEIEPLPIASRELRARLESGDSIRDVIPGPVCDIIGREGLYRPPARVN
jgi:nicotinate-nucleotide adenylyltransferase